MATATSAALLAKLTIQPYLKEDFRIPAGPPWQALFNPTSLAYGRKLEFAKIKEAGSSAPQTQFTGGDADNVTLDLFFDGTGVVADGEEMRERIADLLALTGFQSESHQPCFLHAYWGPFQIKGVATQIDLSYTLFDRDGNPLRATAKMALQGTISTKEKIALERRASPDLYQTWVVREGESLDAIAYRVYGSPAYWRPLAAANSLRSAGAIAAGMLLVLPPLEKSA
jgi:nucleoid-associated protein YgaU